MICQMQFLCFSDRISVLVSQRFWQPLGTNRNAKRTTIIHLTFNIIGTILFTIVCIVTPLTAIVQNFTPDNPAAQIANMHTLFNVVTTLLLLPIWHKTCETGSKNPAGPGGSRAGCSGTYVYQASGGRSRVPDGKCSHCF